MSRRPGSRPRACLVVAAGCVLLALLPARAQDSPSSSTSGNQEKPAEAPARPDANSYAVSLGTGELINMSGGQAPGNASSGEPPSSLTEYDDASLVSLRRREFNNQFLYGLSVASAYVTADSGPGVSGQELTTLVPYLALLVPTKTGGYLVQYSAVVNPNDASVQGGGTKAYHSASLSAHGALSRRWLWALRANGNYGSEAARAEGPLTFLVIQNVSVADASATVRLPATNVLFLANGADLIFQRSPRDTLTFSLSDVYTDIHSNPAAPIVTRNSNTLSMNVGYERSLSSRLSLLGYGDIGTVFIGFGPGCYTYGGGVGLSVRLSYRVRLEVQGGPQGNTPGCGGPENGNFSATVTANVNARDTFYASIKHVFSTAYQVNGTGQDSYVAGFMKGFRRFNFAVDAGYIRETLIAAPTYNGYFIAPRLHFKINKSLGFTAGYRDLHGSGGKVVGGNLNYAVVSLDWYPPGLHFK